VPVQVLLTETAGRLLDERAARVEPAVEQVRMQRDGRLRIDGREVDAGAVQPEVAFATGDMFFRGGAAPWFELLLSLESTSNRTVRLGRATVNGTPLLPIEDVLARFDSVSAGDVASLARELFDARRLSAAGIGPNEDRFRAAVELVNPGLRTKVARAA